MIYFTWHLNLLLTNDLHFYANCLIYPIFGKRAYKMRIILDTDFGDDIDDTYALYYLLKEAKQDVALILSAFGQTQKRAKLICSFLKCRWGEGV